MVVYLDVPAPSVEYTFVRLSALVGSFEAEPVMFPQAQDLDPVIFGEYPLGHYGDLALTDATRTCVVETVSAEAEVAALWGSAEVSFADLAF